MLMEDLYGLVKFISCSLSLQIIGEAPGFESLTTLHHPGAWARSSMRMCSAILWSYTKNSIKGKLEGELWWHQGKSGQTLQIVGTPQT